MTSNGETPEHPDLARVTHSLYDALTKVEGSKDNENINFERFIIELDQNPDFQHYPAYIILKQANTLLISSQGAFLDTVLKEIQLNFYKITSLRSNYIELDLAHPSEEIKRNLAQRGILAIFLWRAAFDGLYTPDTTGMSGIIIKIINSLNPPKKSH